MGNLRLTNLVLISSLLVVGGCAGAIADVGHCRMNGDMVSCEVAYGNCTILYEGKPETQLAQTGGTCVNVEEPETIGLFSPSAPNGHDWHGQTLPKPYLGR